MFLCSPRLRRRVFAFIQKYEHSPRAKPTDKEKFNDDRSSDNHDKPNTAPLAERSLRAREYLTEAEVERLIDAAR